MADQDDLSGRKIGEFVLRNRIGEGGFGAVYCCEQPLLGREAVVKILHRERLRSSVTVQRFLREDAGVRDAWLAGGPQPLAESVAVLDSARNAHQAHIATQELARNLLRYLLAVALAAHAQTREGRDDPALLRLVRALDRRELSIEERVRLVRLLAQPLTNQRSAHPIPELVDLVTPDPDGADGLDPILALSTAAGQAVTDDAVRLQLMRLIPELTQLLRTTAFVLDYVLVVPQSHAAERWTGRRRKPRAVTDVLHGELVKGHPMLLDRAGRVSVDLWPLVQAVPPIDGAEPELFLFDGHGHHGALMIAAPSGLEHHDAVARDWVATRVIAEILSAEFDPTSKLVVAAGANGTVVVADAALGMPVTVLEGPRAVVRVAHFDPSSRRVVGASWDGTARVWDATSPYRRWSAPPIADDCGLIGGVELDQRYLAIGCRDYPTRVRDTARDQLLAELPSVTRVDGDFASAYPAVSADGARAAIARGNTVAIYELPGGRLLRTIAQGAAVTAVSFARTGRDVVSGATDGSLLVTREGHEPIALPAFTSGVSKPRSRRGGSSGDAPRCRRSPPRACRAPATRTRRRFR